jgi:uncharacterized membrane protein YhhN
MVWRKPRPIPEGPQSGFFWIDREGFAATEIPGRPEFSRRPGLSGIRILRKGRFRSIFSIKGGIMTAIAVREIMLKVFITIFLGISAVHLVSLLLKKRNIAAVTKICLLPPLLGVYVCGTENLFVPVIFALIFGWGGDVLLLKISDIRFFRLGLASFLIGHLCYIPSFIFFTEKINAAVLLVSIALGFSLCFVIYLIIRPEKAVSLFVIAYEIVIMLMSLSALQLMLSRRDIRGLLVFAGSLCFLVSDTLLACFTFRGKVKYGDFLVMLLYIAAQALIIGGMAGV